MSMVILILYFTILHVFHLFRMLYSTYVRSKNDSDNVCFFFFFFFFLLVHKHNRMIVFPWRHAHQNPL